MVISKLKPGMTVYNVRRATGRRRYSGKWSTWTVHVIEVDTENNRVLASWNGNKAEWYSEHTWSTWRLKRPEK